MTQSLTISDRAANRILELAGQDPAAGVLRIAVEGGGCSGFQYRFDLIAAPDGDDVVVERDGAKVAVDPVSLPYLSGSELDFVDDLIGSTFRLSNPNAAASCGCGTSFSI